MQLLKIMLQMRIEENVHYIVEWRKQLLQVHTFFPSVCIFVYVYKYMYHEKKDTLQNASSVYLCFISRFAEI